MKYRSYIIILIQIIFMLSALPGKCAVSVDSDSEDNVAEKATSDGSKLADQIYKYALGLHDYKFESTLYMCKPAPRESGAGTYFFKKPNLVKLEIRSKGVKDGTIVVRQPDGRVRIIGGPKLRFLKMNVDPDSRMLQTPNGFNIVKSDFASLFAGINSALVTGSKALVTASPLQLERFKQSVIVLQLVKSDNGAQQLTDRIFIDPRTNTPLEWEIFKNGSLYSITLFENFSANLGLPDDQFQM